MLWNRSLVMYDVETKSNWSHILGRAMDGEMKGTRLEMLPSEIFARQVFTTYEDEKLGVELIPRIGVDNVMWASDYPHGDSTWPPLAHGIGRVAARAAWPRSPAQGDL